jgi:hypothetical protein
MMPSLRRILAGLVLACTGFGLVEWPSPAIRRRWLSRRDLSTDVFYWFFTPLVTKVIARAARLDLTSSRRISRRL